MLYLKDANAASEIVQSVFIRIWDRRELLGDVQKAENFLFIVTRNMVFDHFKKLARNKKVVDESSIRFFISNESTAADHRLYEHEYSELIRSAVNKLPQRQREVYNLYDEGLTYEEIARKLAVSRHTIKRHLEIARRFLRNYVRLVQNENFLSLLLFLFFVPRFFC